MTNDLSIQKRLLRRELRIARQQFFLARGRKSWAPVQPYPRPMFSAGMTVAAYYAMGSEADPATLIDAATAAGATIALPRVDADRVMRFYVSRSKKPLVPDSAGILAPASDALLADPDVILLPLLAFDCHGTRLGQGGGYYDATIAHLDRHRPSGLPRARRIGIAWSIQQVDKLPRDGWDMALDAVATERHWITI